MTTSALTADDGLAQQAADDAAVDSQSHDYRRGQYIGTPAAQLVFNGVNEDGHLHVHSRTVNYRVPDELQSRDEIRAWALQAIANGDIGTDLYPTPTPPATSAAKSPPATPAHVPSKGDAAFETVRSAFRDGTIWRSELTQIAHDVSALTASDKRTLVTHLVH